MVSVIIPLFNRATLIPFTLESLAAHHHHGVALEVLVVDDASTDNGPDRVAQDFPWVKVIRNEKNLGAPACRNKGLAVAKGEYLLFLDSDDWVEKDFFAKKIEYLKHQQAVGGVYGPYEYFESEGAFDLTMVRPRKNKFPLYTEDKESILGHLLQGWYLPPHTILWRKKVIDEIKGYDERLRLNQDVDLCFRAVIRHPLSGIDSPLAWKRIHSGEKVGSVNSEEKLKQVLSLRREFLHALKESNLLHSNLKTALARFCFNKWSEFRLTYPQTAQEFLTLSKELDPNLLISGSAPLKVLARITGNENAIKFKQWFRR